MKTARNKSAYMLLELAVMMGVICLSMAAFYYASVAPGETFIQAEARKLAALWRSMRCKAFSEGATQRLVFNQTDNSYCYAEKYEKLPHDIVFGVPPETAGPPSKPQSAVTHAVTFPRQMIECHADGTMSSGVVYLTTKNHRYTYAVTSCIADIPYIRIYRYEKVWRSIA